MTEKQIKIRKLYNDFKTIINVYAEYKLMKIFINGETKEKPVGLVIHHTQEIRKLD